jgi:D-alanine-D-alanine ligase
MTRSRRANVIALGNENPAWPDIDKAYANEAWQLLLRSLANEGYHCRAFTFFDDISFLEEFDPREWLVVNWGEEWAGEAWSDAEVAARIERYGFAYTGSPPDVLRFTQSRTRIKERLRDAGLPTLPWRTCAQPADAAHWSMFPAIVKGANQHASVGIDRGSVVDTPGELAARIAYLRDAHSDDALVEPFLDTREFQVAVLGNADPEALPPSEILYDTFGDLRDRLHTQAWKMDRDSRGYQEIRMPCPAPLDRPDWRDRIEQVALAAYRAFGLRDYARFDLRMLGDEPQVLDVNANPELDPPSVVQAGAEARGLNYGQLIARIADSAAERMPLHGRDHS